MTQSDLLSERYFTPKEVAALLQVKERVVLDLLRAGRLGGLKATGKIWRIPESALKAFLEESARPKGERPKTPGKRKQG